MQYDRQNEAGRGAGRPVRLICTDIDGTLVLDDHRSIPEENVEALIKAQEGGARLALVSGRGVLSQMQFVKRLHMDRYDGFIIAYTGARIVKVNGPEELFGMPIEITDAAELYEYVSPLGMDVMVYDDTRGVIYATADNEYTRFDQQVTGFGFKLTGKLDHSLGFPTYKCIIAGAQQLLDEKLAMVKARFADGFEITRSSGVFAEFNKKGVSKGAALLTLTGLLGINVEEVLAVGNGENDESMLSIAGMSAAPADAMQGARRAAKFLCWRRNEEGALAEAVTWYHSGGFE